jgi:DNA polymerase-4
LKTADFRLITRSRHLSAPTQLAARLYEAAEPLLEREADGRAFRLIGIGAHDLSTADAPGQIDLFSGGPSTDKVEEALDAVRAKFGDDAVVKGRGFGTKLVRQGPSKT